MTADANKWSQTSSVADPSRAKFATTQPTYQFGVAISELEWHFPPFLRRDVPRDERSIVDYHLRRLTAGQPMDISILRSSERGRRTLGCALQLTDVSHALVCIQPDDPMLNHATFRLEGAPRLTLLHKLDESDWERLDELLAKQENGELHKREATECAQLISIAALMHWHAKFSDDEDLKSLIAERLPVEEAIAAD